MRSDKWGVWGSAGIARRRTIPEGLTKAKNAELVAVYDVNRSANEEVAGEFGGTACTSEEELLGSECEAVYIATPACAHWTSNRSFTRSPGMTSSGGR